MSETAPTGPYIYQPYGMQDQEYWECGRVYAIGGLDNLMTVKGLTRSEAKRILEALRYE